MMTQLIMMPAANPSSTKVLHKACAVSVRSALCVHLGGDMHACTLPTQAVVRSQPTPPGWQLLLRALARAWGGHHAPAQAASACKAMPQVRAVWRHVS